MTTYSGRHDRTGTWQFMSAALLESPMSAALLENSHVLEDDIESFVHVLGWTVPSYLPSPMDEDEREAMVSFLYDDSWKTKAGQEWGGQYKSFHLKSGDYPLEEFTLTEPSPILDLIRNLASPFQARYSKPPPEEDKELFKVLMPRYQLALERLNNLEWFLGTIQDALERPGWPANGGGGC
ncbi:hypothetical protein EDD15DRAFT_2579143 [Pisolithus albus]|nr:hypothetical protein EDD15DRAFT_2579143 [Pisolithus albus]